LVIRGRLRDDAGNVSEDAVLTVRVDPGTTAPQLNPPSPASPTNQQDVTISGFASEIQSRVEVVVDDVVPGLFINTGSGTDFQVVVNLSHGRHRIKARATDRARNVSGFSGSITVEVDTILPRIDSVTYSPHGDRFGGDSIKVRIVGEAGLTPSLFMRHLSTGLELGPWPMEEVPSTGKYESADSFTIPADASGVYKIIGRLTDNAGNLSGRSAVPDLNVTPVYPLRSGSFTIPRVTAFHKFSALAVDSGGNPHLVYLTKSNGTSEFRLKYIRWLGGASQDPTDSEDPNNWSEPIDIGEPVAEQVPCLAIGTDNIPRTVYFRPPEGQSSVVYAILNKQQLQWDTDDVVTVPGSLRFPPVSDSSAFPGTALLLDAQDAPLFSFFSNSDLKFARKDGVGWIFALIDTDCFVGSLALDSNNVVHSAHAASTGSLRYAQRSLTGTTDFNSQFIGGTIAFHAFWRVEIVIDSENFPHIVTHRGNELAHFFKPPGDSLEFVSEIIEAPQGLLENGTQRMEPSLVQFQDPVSEADKFAVSFCHIIRPSGSNQFVGCLRIASRADASAWTTEDADCDSTDPARHNVGHFSSMAVNPMTGKVMVSYQSLREGGIDTNSLKLFVQS
ncbi:MAG TPA: hypothetical protein VK598_07020, partial [Nitrospiraceae bacterium]|nr:hypothetical protein [Nitrospiraceae bacterium]